MINLNKITYFDTETTGVKWNKDKIVSIFCENKHKGWMMNTITDPEVEIPIEASNVHKITNDMVKGKASNKEVLSVLTKIFDNTKIICGYNILKFDIPLVINLGKEHNVDIDYKSYKYIDVYFLIKFLLTQEEINKIGSLTLSNVYKFATGKDLTKAHEARADVMATKAILKWIIENYDVDDCLYLNYEYLINEEVSLNYKFYSGKRAGYTIEELLDLDKDYIKFMVNKNFIKLKSDIIL